MAVTGELAHIVDDLVTHARIAGVMVAMTVESVGIPLPSEVTMPLGGALAGSTAGLLWTIGAGTAGNLLGSWLAYLIGLGGGARWLRPRHLQSAQAWFARYGSGAVFFGRLLPVVRTYISFPAGAARMPFGRFTAYTLAGSLIWSAALAWAGYRLRGAWPVLAAAVGRAVPVVVVLVIAAGIAAWLRARGRLAR